MWRVCKTRWWCEPFETIYFQEQFKYCLPMLEYTKRVRLSVYPGYLPGYYPYPTRFVSCLQYHTLPDKFCESCNTFIPLPCSSSVSFSKPSVYARVEWPERMLVSALLRREMVRTSVNVSPRHAQSMDQSAKSNLCELGNSVSSPKFPLCHTPEGRGHLIIKEKPPKYSCMLHPSATREKNQLCVLSYKSSCS